MSAAPFSVAWLGECLRRPATVDPLVGIAVDLGLDATELVSLLGGTPVEPVRPWEDHLDAAWTQILVDAPELAARVQDIRQRRGTLVLSISDVRHARFTRTAEYDSMSYPARLLVAAPDPVREFREIIDLFARRSAAADARRDPPSTI